MWCVNHLNRPWLEQIYTRSGTEMWTKSSLSKCEQVIRRIRLVYMSDPAADKTPNYLTSPVTFKLSPNYYDFVQTLMLRIT